MIVPRFWAEARLQQRDKKRQFTIRRFGWSDLSLEDAQVNADRRAAEALQRIGAGEKLARREPKAAYNGAEGVPIREEIVDRHQDIIITRNAYGAQCLNTPDVLFVDIDFERTPNRGTAAGVGILLGLGALLAGWTLLSPVIGIVAGLTVWLIGYVIAARLTAIALEKNGGVEQRARARIDRFIGTHPDWHLRIYRTPAGLRVLAMHRTFDPSEAAVTACFDALGADPIYQKMCMNQHCFRARVSPKPWRIGIDAHLRPRPGIWPVSAERIPERRRWIDAYELACGSFASCSFVAALGSDVTTAKALLVQEIHDGLSKAHSGLPIA